MDNQDLSPLFTLLNEIGIINQLSSTRFDQRAPAGLKLSQFSVLNHLTRLGDGQTPLSMANAFQLTKGAITNTLSILERKGFIEVKQNPQDGRSKLVFLTEAGKRAREQAVAEIIGEFSVIADQIDVQGLADIIPKLQQLRSVLDRARD